VPPPCFGTTFGLRLGLGACFGFVAGAGEDRRDTAGARAVPGRPCASAGFPDAPRVPPPVLGTPRARTPLSPAASAALAEGVPTFP